MNAEVKLSRYDILNISKGLVKKKKKLYNECSVCGYKKMYSYCEAKKKKQNQSRTASLIHGFTATK